MPSQNPATVRCNRGFGRWFWRGIGICALLTVVAMVGSGESPWALALIGLGAVGLLLMIRALQPRLTLLPGQQLIRTQRRTVPYAAVTAVHVGRLQSRGIWAVFISDERSRPLTRLALDDTVLAAATVEQWAAVRQIVGLAADSGSQAPVDSERWPPGKRLLPWLGQPMPLAEAIDVLDAQIAWCEAGNRSGHRRAPMRALMGRVVVLR